MIDTGRLNMPMKYRDVEYNVVQGVGGGRFGWRWEVFLVSVRAAGQAASHDDAVAAAQRAIDRALTPKTVKLRPLPVRDDKTPPE